MASSSSSSPEMSAAPSASISQSSVQYAHLSREEVLEELSSRFILNLPDEELASLERVCFQVEQAHWYYEDFIREQNPSKFPSYSLKTFSEALFRACPSLQHWAHDHERAFQSFMQYKTRVPVCGAIMLNETWEKCVLVKGWKSSAGWGFPKGKINEQEPRPRCAAREVLEETGYDLEGQIVPEDVIELSIKEQSISLYIVPGVSEDFPFKTRTRKEISKIAWFKLSDLPTWKRSKAVPGKFYLISPFIAPLKAFIHDRKPRNLPRKASQYRDASIDHDAHVSSEEDPACLDSSPSTRHDVHTQESSSQSSSADNGEPQTPSPQYSAPPVNHHTGVHTANDEALDSLNMQSVDPHFARLLNSLTLSAASAKSSDPAPSLVKSPLPNHSSIAAPEVSPPDTYITTRNNAGHSDWSASVPHTHTELPRPSSVIRNAIPAHRSTMMTPAGSHPTPSITSSDTVITLSSNHLPPPSPKPPAISQITPADMTMDKRSSPLISRPRHAVRVSADISPYLSRPRDISKRDIPKEMKYISMLESVAKESDKVSSLLHHPASPRLPQQSQIYGHSAISAPGPSTSVPPSSLFGRNEPSVIYSSAPTHPAMAVPVTRSTYSSDVPSYDDPFTVRPRTSSAFHQPAYPLPSRKPSVHDDSLRFVPPAWDSRSHISPTRASGVPQQPIAGLPFHGSPVLTRQAPYQQPLAGPGLLPIRVPQHPTSNYGDPAPLSAPAISSTAPFSAAVVHRPTSNAHLLSILNAPSTAPRVASMPAGFPNGMA